MSTDPTIIHSFWRHTSEQPGKTALKYKRDGRYRDITWGEFGNAVQYLVAALRAEGIRSGDVVSILSNNRPEWAMADVAALTLGAVSVSIYATNLPKDIAFILNHSEARLLFVEDRLQLEKIRAIQSPLPSLKKIAVINPEGTDLDEPFVTTWDEFIRHGRELAAANPPDIERLLAALSPEKVAIVIYTSGTTGPPKGVMLTHGNIVFVCGLSSQICMMTGDDRFFSFLPLAHALERMGSLYLPIFLGAQVGYAERMETVAENLAEVSPSIVAGVPRFFEKIHQRVVATVKASPMLRRKLFEWTMKIGRRSIPDRIARRPLPVWLKIQYGIADRLAFRKLRGRLGGRLRFFISGGAPLSQEIAEFFYALGLPIFEAYGATETTAPTSGNCFENFKFGTVGKPLPGVEVTIAEDGEILVRGQNVFAGYFKDDRATAEALVDGWYHSGDIGRLDEDGFLVILDRKKELIITSAGKNISPQNIEGLLKRDALISQAVAIGDRHNYLTALITLNPEAADEWVHAQGIPTGSTPAWNVHPGIVARVQEIVGEVNRQLARFEQIKRFHILPADFSQATGELTPTLKLRRKFIVEKYAREIAAMYDEGAPGPGGSLAPS